MQNTNVGLKDKLNILESLDNFDAMDVKMFRQKFAVLRDIALMLVEEIEAYDCVRSINLSQGINLHEEMRTFEIHLIQSALERTGGHQTKAAQLLGINLTTLHNKLKRLNISTRILVNAPVIHEDEFYKTEPSSVKPLESYTDEHFSRLAA
jgi:transcriptional regulator with AAA-type ATPase domain